MTLTKRPRHSMSRTTSMTEFAADVEASQCQPSDLEWADRHLHLLCQQRRAAVPSQRRGGGGSRRRISWDFAALETAAYFLMACGLCKRRLGPGRDTFMYRGDIAFCSLECRHQHMKEERKEKSSLTSMKDTPRAPINGSDDSNSSGGAAAA